MTVEITFVRESIQVDEQTKATFRTTPEIMADVSAYDQRELVARLLAAHLPDCSVHPEQKVEYPSPDDPEKSIKKFKAVAKTLSVPFVIYADFEAFLVPAEENKE